MPTVRDIESFLFEFAPKELAMAHDNVGLLIGDPDRAVSRVLVALDITPAVAREAAEGEFSLIVAHHPVMNCHWTPVQSLRPDTPPGSLLIRLVKQDTACICMHTNLDRTEGGVNDCLASTLGLRDAAVLPDSDGFCRMGTLSEPMALDRFAQAVSVALQSPGIRYASGGKPVYRVAVGGGACGEYADAAAAAGCDTFVTADIKYHGFLDAAARGLNLLDAGHFSTEDPVCGKLLRLLTAEFSALTVQKSRTHREVTQFYSR